LKEPGPLHRRSLSDPGFSLIELLAVVAILALITALMWGKQGPSRRERGLASCQQNLEKIYLAMQVYSQDYAGKFPVSSNAQTSEDPLALLVPRYSSDTSIFVCPVSKDPPLPAGKSFREGKISYAYYMGRRETNADAALLTDAQINTNPKHSGALVFSDDGKPPGNNHGKDGGNVLVCDGTVVPASNNAPISLIFAAPVVLLNPKP
jgi:prepilin-type N-terminal cleavage/methylation domain-containing protein